MSVGFVGSSYQSLSDISSSGARLDASLQGVLSKYDSIKTDLDRLSNNASFNVYDLTSRQQYNAYNNESQNGWSESWYSEYKAVLQLRADALKKKLERSYNQVLEKSVFTEIEPDNNSVFAPYANRTASLTQTDFQTPVSEILVKDVAIGSVATVAPPATPTSVVFDSILDYLKAPSARINSTTTITQAIADPGATLASNTVNPASTLFSSIPALKQGQYEALYNAISDSFVTATYVDGNGVTQTGIPNPPTTNPQKKKAKLVSDSVIAMFGQLSTAVVPGLPAGMNLMDYYLPYGRVGSIKTLLAAGTITLPAAGAAIAGYQPASYYNGTSTFTPALLPLPVAGIFKDGNFVGPAPAAINTPSQSQSQNAAETNPGYLFDVDFSSTAASTMTINGVNSTGGSVGASSPVSVFSLTTPVAPPAMAVAAVGSIDTTGKVYKRSLGIDDSVSTDFIQYGSTPSTITVYIDDLPASASAVGAQVISLMNDAAGSKLGGFDSGTGSNVTLTQLPPPGKTVVFRSKFPTSWYYNNDPRLGLKSGVGTNPPNVNVDDYIDRATNPYHAEPDGLYTMLRNAGASAPPSTPPGAGVTPAPTAPPPTAPLGVPSNPTELKYDDAYEKAIGNADLNSNKNYSNIRDQLPMYGTGVILDPDEIFKGMPPSVKDTMLKDPNIMADLTASMNSMVNSFVGREYDDIVGGNYYDGEFECSDSSPLIMLSTMSGPSAVYISSLPEAYMPSSSLLYAGGGTIWGLLPTPAPTSVVTIGIGPDANFGHLSAVNDAGGFVTPIPTVGLFSVGMNVPIPLPYPLAPLTIWAGARTQKTHDVAAEFIEKFLAAVKPLVVEAVQTQAYSASSGSAFDTYASRGEYHFSTPGYLEAMKKLKLEVFGIEIPIGDMIESFIKGGGLASLVGLGNAGWGQAAYGTDINGASAGTRLFDYQQSNQGAEARETDSGAFFATQSFLSQFEMKNMESEYWIGTQQNEEVVNNDMLRALQTAGGQIMSMMTRTLAAAATAGNLNPLAGALLKVIVDAIDAMNAKATQEMWYKMLYGDIDYQGSGLGSNGWIKGEGYDYIEDDHKPFEADSDFNYPDPPPMNLGTMVAGILGADASMFTAKKPNFIMDGYSATRRFRKATDTSDAIESITTLALTPTDASQENGFGARSHAGRGGASPSGTDNGLWQDTALGDINEVYVGRRKVVFNNLDQGFGSFETATITGAGSNITNTGTSGGTSVSAAANVSTATRKTYAFADRYTGADTRAYGRRYDGGTPINFESFNTGMYSDGVNTGSRYHYDRRNEYSLSFQTAASNNVVNLQGSQALNPSIGGFIKMGEIDKNKTDDALLQYESIDQATLFKTSAVSDHVLNLSTQTRGVNEQKFGASADGELNDLNKTLYEAMHLRADGRNLSEFNQYRDVFNMGFMKNIFISGQSYHPSGGGVTSSIEIRYDSFSGTQSVQTDTRENYNSNTNFDPYNALSLNKSRGKASIYLNNYFAYKKRANKK